MTSGPMTLIAAAGLLGVDPAELRAACAPSTRTMADVINDAPHVSISEVEAAEAARLGKPVDELTEDESRAAVCRAVLVAITRRSEPACLRCGAPVDITARTDHETGTTDHTARCHGATVKATTWPRVSLPTGAVTWQLLRALQRTPEVQA